MPKITLKNLQNKAIDYTQQKESLLQILLEHTDWMHACGAKGRCTTCKAIIHEGLNDLSKLTTAEIRFKNMGRLAANERLTCQLKELNSDLVISVAEENKLPHLNYS